VTEARREKLDELVPKALRVLELNLESEYEHLRQRAAETVLDRAWGKPTMMVAQQPSLTHPLLPDMEELMAMPREQLERTADALRPIEARCEGVAPSGSLLS
jgi:hypothetical protein